MELGTQVWPEVVAESVLLIPLGSTEQHGPHLPMDTDARIAHAVARGAAASASASVTVAPVLAYGASGEHQGFAGTLSMGTEALQAVLAELVRSAAHTFSRVVFVNGHGGNIEGVRLATDQLVAEGHDVVSWSPSLPDSDAHAGHTETSLMLAIAPDLVRLAKAQAGNVAPLRDLIDDMRRGGVMAVSANGVLGDPAGSSPDKGEELLAALIEQLVDAIA